MKKKNESVEGVNWTDIFGKITTFFNKISICSTKSILNLFFSMSMIINFTTRKYEKLNEQCFNVCSVQILNWI